MTTATPLGLGIVGTGNIAGGYARDAVTHPEIRLVSVTDIDIDRATAFAAEHGTRIDPSLDDLLANPEVDIVVNLTVHQAHFDVTRRALEAGRHVYSEKPLALSGADAHALADVAVERGVRLGCSPSTFLGEAQQTAAAWVRSGRLGTVRAVYCEVPWGRIRAWHPGPGPFFRVAGARAVLRRRRARRRGRVPVDTRDDDARPRRVSPCLGLGADARPRDSGRD